MSFTLIRSCPACGTKNRAPARHLADDGRCGACQASLPPVDEPIDADAQSFDPILNETSVPVLVDEPIDADAQSFDPILNETSVPVLVDFWAGWCAPCRMVAPEVRELAREMAGQALVLKVDTEAQPALAARFRVQSIPYLAVFRNGAIVHQQPGAASRAEMRRWIEDAS